MARNEVLELIQEEPGSGLTIDDILSRIPKSNKKAQEFYIQLIEHIKNELLAERELDIKIKKIMNKVKLTDLMKAVKQLKTERGKKKKANHQMLLVLHGCRKMAKAAGIDLSAVKSLIVNNNG